MSLQKQLEKSCLFKRTVVDRLKDSRQELLKLAAKNCIFAVS